LEELFELITTGGGDKNPSLIIFNFVLVSATKDMLIFFHVQTLSIIFFNSVLIVLTFEENQETEEYIFSVLYVSNKK